VVLWDFDGVIADTEPLHEESYREVLMELGFGEHRNVLSGLIGKTESEIWDLIALRGFEFQKPKSELASHRKRIFLRLALESLSPSWLALDLLPTLGSIVDGQFLLSNGDPETIDILLREWQLDKYLERPASHGSDEVQPKADRLRSLLKGRRSVVFEDNGSYLAKARGLGAFCVAVHHSLSPSQGITGNVEVSIAIDVEFE
jgi:beta-phosphoglucomutase-like phosphatase (HAD superfamily)